MRKLAYLMLVLGCQPTLGAVLTDDAYVCKDKRVAQRLVGDRDLAALAANQLSERAASAGDEITRQIAQLDRDIGKIQQRVDADREAMKSAKALEFQAGIRQNWRPTEQALREGEAKIVSLSGDRDRLLGEQQRWTAITSSCVQPEERTKIVVINARATSKLAVVRVRAGASTARVWVATRFIVKSARSKK